MNLPMTFKVSFEKVYEAYKQYAEPEFKDHFYHNLATKMSVAVDEYPELIAGIEDFNWLERNLDIAEPMLTPLFPEALTTNEIKAVGIPFSFHYFKLTDRFEKILDDAGGNFELKMEIEESMMYIHACVMILAVVHGRFIDLRRPFYFDIPDSHGNELNYRVAFNADLASITAKPNAPEITDEDFAVLLNSFDNIDIWKEKFPAESYEFKGIGIMNLFDVTSDQSISDIRTNLLKGDQETMIHDLELSLRKFFNISDLKIGYSVFELPNDNLKEARIKDAESLIINKNDDVCCTNFFCEGILNNIFGEIKPLAISNTAEYAQSSGNNPFSQVMKKNNVGSIILIPIVPKERKDLAILEIASPRPFELNSITLQKLDDVIPMFEFAVERSSKEMENLIEATIQDKYTAIHPSVKWRFSHAAENYIMQTEKKQENIKLENIVFDNVYPLFGQSDIKGSSVARNESIKADLLTQLTLASEIMNAARKHEAIPIYEELNFRITEYIDHVKDGLKAGDEVVIVNFLKQDIYPVFDHIKTMNASIAEMIKAYEDRIDSELKVIYEKRKDYEDSVTLLNDKLAEYIDKREMEAQEMFPHYFERYKTDGVEHDIYIGDSLVQDKKFDKIYLHNLRLWQLQLMSEMENLAYNTIPEMNHELRIASMILVHSNPLAIRFRMDEKQFDVDGAYNIRYAIIKKRIDKAHIKGTEERLTVPGKLSIVYSQDKDKEEYLKYIKFLQAKNLFGEVEDLVLEDLQGVSGLKALRVEIIYNKEFDEASTQAMNELIKEFQS